MELFDYIRTRRSVRTFDRSPLTSADRKNIEEFAAQIKNPYGIPVRFVFLDAEENGLSSPVLKGEPLYVAAMAEKDIPHSEEAFGYSFEELVLHAASLGIGTTIIAGTMNRALFEEKAGVRDGERMYCMSPLGYPAGKMAIKEKLMRKGVKADERKEREELFFSEKFGTPLLGTHGDIDEALEAVRLAPSAVNKQPWRIVEKDGSFHFYEKHDKGYVSEETGDLQKVDMGIALCHFMKIAGGTLTVSDPGINTPEGTEYIATVTP